MPKGSGKGWHGPRPVGNPSPPYSDADGGSSKKKLTPRGEKIRGKVKDRKISKEIKAYPIYNSLNPKEKHIARANIDLYRLDGKKIKFRKAKTVVQLNNFTEKYISHEALHDFDNKNGNRDKQVLKCGNIINEELSNLYNDFNTIPRLGALVTQWELDNGSFNNYSDDLNNNTFYDKNEDTRWIHLNVSRNHHTELTVGIPEQLINSSKRIPLMIHASEGNIDYYGRNIKEAKADIKIDYDLTRETGIPINMKYINDLKGSIERMSNGLKKEKQRLDSLNNIVKYQKNKISEKEYYPYNSIHSMYCFPQTRRGDIRATTIHEFGHSVHYAYYDKINKVIDNIRFGTPNPKERITSEYEYVGKGSIFPTERSRDSMYECVAENFTLYYIGKRDCIHPEVAKIFDDIKEGKF